jgi:hypothetical protein
MMERMLAGIASLQEETKTNNEMLSKMNASQDGTIAKMDAWLEEMEASLKETKSCREETETCLESNLPTSVEIESVAMHEGGPKEGAAVKSVRALKEQYGDRNLAVGRRPTAEESDPGRW